MQTVTEIELSEYPVAKDQEIASRIFERYKKYYRGEVQGCCLVIADEIQKTIGGDVVAGEITWYGGSCRRTHWWVDKEGEIFDPMGDWMLSFEEAPGRHECHRNRLFFDIILVDYEKYRIPSEEGCGHANSY